VPAASSNWQPIGHTVDSTLQPQQPWTVTETKPPRVPPAQPTDSDQPLPIDLCTALRLANARPLVIEAAQASMRTAVAQYDQAKVLWLPNLYVGGSWYNHDGIAQGNSGTAFVNTRNDLMVGGGVTAVVSAADAIYAPLAARQVVRSRTIDVQAARNDALLTTAEAYFNVQQARGRLAGALDTVEKGRKLVSTIAALAKTLTATVEIERAATDLADMEQNEDIAREQWRAASAELARALRLPPSALVVPLEQPHLQVTLIAVHQPVDKLIAIGLVNRPELASQQALVQATLVRLRQERMRPLIPMVVVGGDAAPAAPGGYLMGGVFGSNLNGSSNPWAGRNDVNVQVLWELRNLGFGNLAAVRERQAERDQAVVESLRIQDQIAAEVVSAHAQLESAAARAGKAETGLRKAEITFAGNLKGLSETTRFGDVLVLVNRPQEAVAALQQLSRAYDNYFLTVNDYNRAQFRLFRAMGYAAEGLSSDCLPANCQPAATPLPPFVPPSGDQKR
jgi:outer membrane protein TolC